MLVFIMLVYNFSCKDCFFLLNLIILALKILKLIYLRCPFICLVWIVILEMNELSSIVLFCAKHTFFREVSF